MRIQRRAANSTIIFLACWMLSMVRHRWNTPAQFADYLNSEIEKVAKARESRESGTSGKDTQI
jgi:hypothetical protein